MKTFILKFDHLSNLPLRRLYYIDAWRLHCIDAYSWNRVEMPWEEHIYCISEIWVL